MKTMRKNILLQLALIIVACICAILFITTSSPTSQSAQASVSEVVTPVHVGDVINANDYTISYNGSSVKAEGMTVVYPSGGVYGGGKSTVMNQAGIYEITYYANVDGQRVEETKKYMAVRMPQDLITGESGMPIGYGKYEVVGSPYALQKETYGALVEFRAGQSITFNTTIKTSELTAANDILEMIVMPSIFNETDFEKLIVRITDSADENNYVDVIIISSNKVDGNGQVSYVQAGANGQHYGGYEGTRFHMNSPLYGAQVEHSFRALARRTDSREDQTVSEHALTLAIDNETKQVYCGPVSNTSDAKYMVNDLDNPEQYKGNPWGGFIGEEVTVKITAERFVKSTGKLLIKSFGDFSFAQEVKDTEKPNLKVLYDETEALPIAKVGSNFSIFPYEAKDVLDKDIKTDVFVYYVDENGRRINVENNGDSFFAKYAGKYQIVYRAKDYSGNVEEKTLEILAQDEIPEIKVELDALAIEKMVYETVSIPSASDVAVFGGSGYLTVERFVYDPNDELLDVSNDLTLTLLGDYRIVYVVTDYVGNESSNAMIITSAERDKPYFVEEPSYDSVFIKGFKYEIFDLFVIETVNGEVKEVPCKVFLNDEEISGSFQAEGESMTLRYVAEGETGTTEWTKTISVVDTEKGKYKSRYFYTESNMTIEDEKAYLNFSFGEDSTAEFINPLSTQNFALTFSYEENNINFEKIAILLIDAHNKNHEVTLRLLYNRELNAWSLQMNDSTEEVEYMASKNIIPFTLLNGSKIMDASGTGIATIHSYDNGEAFEGFGDTIYLRLSFENVSDESSVYLTQVGNQSMGYNKSSIEKALDEINPTIVLDESFMMRQKLGTKVRIPTAKAYDVLGQIKEFTITLTFNGEVLASGSATEKVDYTLSEAGTYIATYYAKDTNGNFKRIPYAIRVDDETTPTLNVKDSLKSSYKLNAKISVPSYTAKDNNENCYVQVTVTLPNNEVRLLQYKHNSELVYVLDQDAELYEKAFIADKDTFVALYKGKYVLRIVAYDDYYNYVAEEFEFIVK